MNWKQFLIPFVFFLGAVWAGNAVNDWLRPMLGASGQGWLGYLISGLVTFAIYWMIVNKIRHADPTE